jgi:hypothetical protein
MGSYMALLIPLAPFLIAGFAIWSSHQRKMAVLMSQQAADQAAHYSAVNARLEERVRVLERIVTDKGFETALAIEELRDAPKLTDDRLAS